MLVDTRTGCCRRRVGPVPRSWSRSLADSTEKRQMKTPALVRALFPSAVFAVVIASATNVSAQASGFAVSRFEPSERGSHWFTNESLDLRGHMKGRAGVVFDGAYRPLAIYN